MRFQGKRAVVTGGASGIGRGTAERLASEGAEVWIGDIDDAGGQAVADSVGGRYRHCDVSDPAQIQALIAEAYAAGGLDYLVNNAGAGGSRERIDAIEPDDWDHTHALLLRSVAMGIRYAAPLMAKRGGGAIVNTSSVSAFQSGAAPIAYSVAKAGVIHLTRIAAAELAQHNIRVNAVAPGFITTNIFTAAIGIEGEALERANMVVAGAAAQAQPIRRSGRPEDIAGSIAFLLSDDAGFVTGTHLLIDGGMNIGPRHSWDPAAPSFFDAIRKAAGQ